jgi:hypothetical protein
MVTIRGDFSRFTNLEHVAVRISETLQIDAKLTQTASFSYLQIK